MAVKKRLSSENQSAFIDAVVKVGVDRTLIATAIQDATRKVDGRPAEPPTQAAQHSIMNEALGILMAAQMSGGRRHTALDGLRRRAKADLDSARAAAQPSKQRRSPSPTSTTAKSTAIAKPKPKAKTPKVDLPEARSYVLLSTMINQGIDKQVAKVELEKAYKKIRDDTPSITPQLFEFLVLKRTVLKVLLMPDIDHRVQDHLVTLLRDVLRRIELTHRPPR